MSLKNRKLGQGIQQLEAKTMMAGDVAVAVSGGDLFINEAADSIGQDQQVEVRQLDNGMVRVQGLNGTQIEQSFTWTNPWTGQRQTFTGHYNYRDYSVSDDIRVDLGNGRDNFTTNAGGPALEVDELKVDMGDDAERDFVALRNISTTGKVEIDTGDGNDSVSVTHSDIGVGSSWRGDLDIDTGNGQDVVSLFNVDVSDDVTIDTALNVWAAEIDRVMINQSQMDDLDVDLGGGNDQLDIYYSTLDDAEVDGGVGNDNVVAVGNTADDFEFDGGSGLDRFYAYYAAGQDTNDIDDLDLNSAFFTAYGQV